MTIGITALSIIDFIGSISVLTWCFYAMWHTWLCRYAEWRYAECHYDEGRGTVLDGKNSFKNFYWPLPWLQKWNSNIFFQFLFEHRVQHLKGVTIYDATDISLQQNIFAFMNKNVLLNNANHKQPLKLEHFKHSVWWGKPSSKQTFIKADLHRSRPSSKQTFIETDIGRQ